MILFWLMAGLVAIAAALLILMRAARAEKAAGEGDPRLIVYRRQLEEIDELAERGLLGPEEHRAARAEAARRLLSHAEASAPAGPPSPAGRRLALAGAVLAPAAALGIYLVLGSPGFQDEPYKARLKQWRQAAATDPGRLNIDETAAVLESIAAERPKDAQAWLYLGRLRLDEGDAGSAVRALNRAAALAPDSAAVWSLLGQAEVAAGQGEVTPDARQAFARALAVEPKAVVPRYYLARADIAAGRVQPGLQAWRALASELPAGDSRRAELQGQIDQVARTGALPRAADQAQAAQDAGQQAAFIQSMVDRLAARLKAKPDDPEGWARLIRAYGVLGQSRQRQQAIATAKALFKDRPKDLDTALSTAR